MLTNIMLAVMVLGLLLNCGGLLFKSDSVTGKKMHIMGDTLFVTGLAVIILTR